MDLQLRDKVAVVTGSSRGLGFATAAALVDEGCNVCICARGAEQLERARHELEDRARDRVAAVKADLTTVEGVERVVAGAVTRFGGLDILVNNVGLAGGGGLLETADADWQAAFDNTLYPAIRA